LPCDNGQSGPYVWETSINGAVIYIQLHVYSQTWSRSYGDASLGEFTAAWVKICLSNLDDNLKQCDSKLEPIIYWGPYVWETI